MVNIAPPEDPAPSIAGTAELLQQVLYHNQELMWLLLSKDVKSCRKNTNRHPTPSTGPCKGKPLHHIPAYFDKYFWTHGWGSHKCGNCNSKEHGNKDKATMDIRMDRRNYGCTAWRCETVPNVATNNNRNLYWNIQTVLWSQTTLCHTSMRY